MLLRCFTGVGRIIAEAKKLPIILPMWMIGKCTVVISCVRIILESISVISAGSNDILPSEGLLIPRLFKVNSRV